MKRKGSALIDYAIPLAVVSIVAGLGFYNLFASGNLLKFLASSGLIKVDSLNKIATVGGDLKTVTYKGKDFDLTGGALGGTPDNPVKVCEGDTCTIDFGEFILTDVPTQFENFVETAGTSGGTDKLLSLLDQLIAQMEAMNDTEGAAELKKFANQGHALAALEEKMETIAKSCSGAANPRVCFTDAYSASSSYKDLQSELAAILDSPNTYSTLSDYINSIRSDKAVYDTKVAKTKDLTSCSNSELGCAFYSQYSSINTDNKFSSTVKALVEETYVDITKLCSNIAALAEAMGLVEKEESVQVPIEGCSCKCMSPPCASTLCANYCSTTETQTVITDANPNQVIYDPLTGQPTTKDFSNQRSSVSSITNPKTSTVTHLDSKIVCISGKNDDNGYKCE